MTRRDDSVALRHMLDHAEETVAMGRDRTRSDLDQDRQFCLAVLKLVEIIGEAASRVSQSTRDSSPDVLWDIVKLDLPPLIVSLRQIAGS